jgi:MoaA/NifB/PqqE/SkfB family radical SAM enzyme
VHARRKGLEVTVFTNASLIDGKAADLFREWPPFSVEVSVYGLTEPTARVVTGVEDACEAQWAGVRRLKEAGVPVTLKVLAIRPIRHEIEAIEERARREGLKLRLTTELTPGTRRPWPCGWIPRMPWRWRPGSRGGRSR